MATINRKHICKIVSTKNNLDFYMVDDIVSFYYKRVKHELSNPKSLNIQIEKIGIFQVLKHKVIAKINSINKIILTYKAKDDMKAYALRERKKKDLDELENLLDLFDQQDIDKQEKRKLREEQNRKTV